MKQVLLTILFALTLGTSGLVAKAASVTPIIPAPMKAEARPGTFQLTSTSRIVTDNSLKETAELLAERLRSATGFALPIKSSEASANDITLTTNGADTSLGPEGYSLSVAPTGVTIRATTSAGAFYGSKSLLQLFPP